MKREKFLFLIVLPILVICVFALFKSIQKSKEIKDSFPCMLVGENIKYFDLINKNGKKINKSILKIEKPSLIFIFSRPCSICNKNIVFWKKMVEILKDNVSIYGIVLDNSNQAYNLSKRARLNFNIYVPEDMKKFEEKLILKLNLAQTIIYYNNEIKFIWLGDLDSKKTKEIIKLSRNLM